MNKWMTGCVVGLSLLAGSVLGQDLAARKATAEELLVVMKTPEMIGKTFESMKQMIPNQVKQMAGSMGDTNVPTEVNAQIQKMMDLMSEEFSWAKMKADFIALYAETFTAAEMKDMITFYKSPAGQAFINKQPELMKRSMEVSQKIMMRVMPKIKAMADEIKPRDGKGPSASDADGVNASSPALPTNPGGEKDMTAGPPKDRGVEKHTSVAAPTNPGGEKDMTPGPPKDPGRAKDMKPATTTDPGDTKATK